MSPRFSQEHLTVQGNCDKMWVSFRSATFVAVFFGMLNIYELHENRACESVTANMRAAIACTLCLPEVCMKTTSLCK